MLLQRQSRSHFRGRQSSAASVSRTAKLFAQHGATVAILDLDEAGAQQPRWNSDLNIAASSVNVADPASCRRPRRGSIEAFGKADILLANAGITQPLKFMDITTENWNQVLDVNLGGVFYL